MFFLSFGFAYRYQTLLTTSLLIAGGSLLAVSKIVEPILGSNLYLALALPSLYYALIIVGFLILGLGISRLIRKYYEAWGFTGKQTGYFIAPLIPVVGCWSCIKYGRKFGRVAKKDECTASDFEPLISDFLVHWNQKHKSVTNRKAIKH